VHVPGGWEARSIPALEREDDTLRGSFEGIPDDTLLVSTGPPVPDEYNRTILFMLTLWLILLGSGMPLCWWVGRRLGVARARLSLAGRRKSLAARLCGIAVRILPAFSWGVLLYVAVPCSFRWVLASLNGQESPSFGSSVGVVPCLHLFLFPLL